MSPSDAAYRGIILGYSMYQYGNQLPLILSLPFTDLLFILFYFC